MFRVALAIAFLFATGVPQARGDVYTWVDANGKVNVSNLTPPDDATVSSVVHEAPRPPVPPAPIVVAAAPQADVQILAERIRQLEYEVEFARRQPPPPVQYVPVPSQPMMQYATEPEPQPTYGWCDQAWNGCWNSWGNGWGFGAYPVGVVVLSSPNFHRPFGGRGFHRQPMPKAQMPMHMEMHAQAPLYTRGNAPRR